MQNNSLKKIKAFTLAEVLITLGIIGIVAAMTIPTLISNYQKQQTVEQLKKVYSTFSQALQQSTQNDENGPTSGWGYSDLKLAVEKYFLPYLSVQKNCGIHTFDDCKSYPFYWLNNAASGYYSFNTYNIILNDGTSVFFYNNAATILDIVVDINGAKKPNVTGKDIFFLRTLNYNNRINFIGNENSIYTRTRFTTDEMYKCNKDANGQAGLYCGALIQFDGWQIKDDYPW